MAARLMSTSAPRRRQHQQRPLSKKSDQIANRFPENPTAEEKLRLVFEELDLRDVNCVERDGLHRVLGALNIDFTTATIEDLYDRMDVNKKERVTYCEFKDWAAQYPSLIDAVYNRSREVVEKVRGEAKVEEKQKELEAIEKRERAANAKWKDAEKALDKVEREVATLEEVIESRKEEEKLATRDVLEAERDATFARTEVDAKRKNHLAAQSLERERYIPLSAAARQTEKMEKQAVTFQHTLYEMQERERALVDELDRLKADIKQTVDAIGEAHIEVDKSKEWEEQLKKEHEEAVKAVDDCLKEVQEAERQATKQQENAEKASKRQKQCLAETKQAQQEHQRVKQQMRQVKLREEDKRAVHKAAVAQMEEADAALRAVEQDLAARHKNTAQLEHDEQPLLEHEVRLREQRYNLDDRDDVHWEETGRFLAVNKLPDTRRGVAAHKTPSVPRASSPAAGGGHISIVPHAGRFNTPVRQQRRA